MGLQGHYKSVLSLHVFYNHDKKKAYLASSGLDNMIRIWDLIRYTKVKKFKASSPIFSLETFFDTRSGISYIVSGHKDGTVSFWGEESKHRIIKASTNGANICRV